MMASAQSNEAISVAESDQVKDLDTIIVTTQRRETTIQEIPGSVSAYSDDRLDRSNIASVDEVQFLSAGINIGEYLSTPIVTVRAIGNDNLTAISDSGVAVFSDGVYLGRRAHYPAAFFDIKRVEILKGPQGSLYGRNATGGAINLVQNEPTIQPEGRLLVGLGSDNYADVDGHMSGPLSAEGNVRGRLAFKRTSQDGFTAAPAIGDNYDDKNRLFVRGKLAVDLSPSIELEITGDYSLDKSTPGVLTERSDQNILTVGELFGGVLTTGRATNGEFLHQQRIETWGGAAKLTWELGEINLTSLTAYRDVDTESFLDLDGSNVAAVILNPSSIDVSQFSQDFILTGEQGPIDWVAGLQFFDETGDNTSIFNGDFIIAAPDLKSETVAGFGEVTYAFSDRLRATIGARWSRDEKEIVDFLQLAAGTSFTSNASDNWTSFTPNVSLSYDVSDDITSYATIGTGFKSGTFNIGSLSPDSVEPEEVINYELGIKGNFFDHRLRLNAAAFFMDYKDLQVFQTRAQSSLVENASDAEILGAEVEFAAQLFDSLSLDGSLSFLDATYKDFQSEDPIAGGVLIDVSGNRLTATPEVSLNLGASILFDVWQEDDAHLRIDYRYQDEVFFRPFNDDLTRQPAHSWLNASIGLDLPQRGWRAELFGKNLTDELVYGHQFLGSSALGFPRYSIALDGRTVGVELSYAFGATR